MKRKVRAASSLSPGPRIVRAWFDTVINPILAGLEKEQRLLDKQNWTWQFRPEGLESIRPVAVWVRAGVRVDAWPNLEQFLTFHLGIKQHVNRHDSAVRLLSEECAKCHKLLKKSSELAEAYSEAISPESIGRIAEKYPSGRGSVQVDLSANDLVREYFGAYEKEDHLALLAQYILNRTAQLPNYFTTAPLWNECHQRFLAVLDARGIRPAYEAVLGLGAKLIKINNSLIRELKETRLKLSLEHDVPYVTNDERLEVGAEWPPR